MDHLALATVAHLVVLRPVGSEHDLPGTASASAATGTAAAARQRDFKPVAFASLMLQLMGKANRMVVVDDAPSVMVELHRGGQAVVLVDPPTTATTIELITAVTRYYPRVTLWQAQHDPHDDGLTLARIASAASVSAASQPHVLLDEMHHPQPGGRRATTSPAIALVSDEELAMLMSPMRDDDES